MSLSVFRVATHHPGFSYPRLTWGGDTTASRSHSWGECGVTAGGWRRLLCAPCGCACLCHSLWGLLGEDSRPGGKARRRKPFPKCRRHLLGSRSPGGPSLRASPCRPQIQTALRHKSEIEHHRNKIRLRAKRRGHYDFPVLDELSSGDTRERHRVYRRAQMQIDKILDPTASVPSVFIEPRKRWGPQGRGRVALPSQLGVGGVQGGGGASENEPKRFLHRQAVWMCTARAA